MRPGLLTPVKRAHLGGNPHRQSRTWRCSEMTRSPTLLPCLKSAVSWRMFAVTWQSNPHCSEALCSLQTGLFAHTICLWPHSFPSQQWSRLFACLFPAARKIRGLICPVQCALWLLRHGHTTNVAACLNDCRTYWKCPTTERLPNWIISASKQGPS